MKRNEIIGEIKANPDYLRAAERSRSQAQDTQRTFGKSSEEKAAARRKEIKRDKGIQGYSKRHRKENPDMYPKVKPRDDMKTSSGPQDWYGQNRYMGDSVEKGFPKDPNAPKLVRDRKTGKQYDPNKEFEKKMTSPEVMAQMKRMAKKEGVAEALEEGASDYVGDAIEGLRMAKPGLEKEDFLDELYSYIDAEMGMEAAERAFADKGSYDDWYDSYADAMDENTDMLKVAKDDSQQTILQNPTTGVQTQIDKKNPNAPRLTKDDQGKLKLDTPQGAQAGGSLGSAPKEEPLVGKDVQVSQMPEMVDIRRLAGLK
jgi:hypothetical protein